MRLAELLAGLNSIGVAPVSNNGIGQLNITGITADSRAVQPGYLFAALPGSKLDGRGFITAAKQKGAIAVLAPVGTQAELPVITSFEPRHALALIAARFYGRQPATIAAVTGTNGKTSVAAFTRQLWMLEGYKAASIGTLGVVAPDRPITPSLTTPDPVALHALLAELADAGVDYLAVEASSHGLDQYRLDGLVLQAAAFTNLSRDHLDYHQDMAGYLTAKTALFARILPSNGTAVLNADVPEFEALKTIAQGQGQRIIAYGSTGADLRLVDRQPTATGQHMTVTAFGTRYDLDLPLVGAFQAANALAAAGLVIGCGGDVARTIARLESLSVVRGRLEHAATTPAGAPIYVDYAHTPDALETVLTAVRPHVEGKLVVVFGCGGDRDTGKRPLMGEIAARLADRAIVTDDNPRSEDPAAIRRAVLAAMDHGTAKVEEIGDRAQAIRQAIRSLRTGDMLIIAGKGHEQGQTIAGVTKPFDDVTVARGAVDDMAECGA